VGRCHLHQSRGHHRARPPGPADGESYSKASEVLIWLGEDSKGATVPELPFQQFFTGLYQIANEIRKRRRNGEISYEGPRYRSFISWRDRRAKSFRITQLQFSQLDTVFYRRWWKRAWVLQEVVLAKSAHLFCGDVLDLLDLEEINNCVCEEGSQASLSAFSFLSWTAGPLSLRMGTRNSVIASNSELASWLYLCYLAQDTMKPLIHETKSTAS
jgi:hypothetical protein